MYLYWPTDQWVRYDCFIYLYVCWPTDQCVSHARQTHACIQAYIPVYHTIYGHVSIQTYSQVCTTWLLYMYLKWHTDQCVPNDSYTHRYLYRPTDQFVPHGTGYDDLQTSVYHSTYVYVSILVYRPVCAIRQVDMYLHRYTERCVPHDTWTCTDTGLPWPFDSTRSVGQYTDKTRQPSVYHMIAVYVSQLVHIPMCTKWQLYICIYAGLHNSLYHITAVYVYIYLPTDQCVPLNKCICIYSGLQTSMCHMIAA